MKVFGTGLTGLVGSRIVGLLGNRYSFNNLSRTTGADITDYSSLKHLEEDTQSPLLIHMAAKTDVDRCEVDRSLGEEGEAWKINVGATQNIVNACRKTKKKIIYVSTDFVFDGERGNYTEEDIPHPINWYADTKYQGEEIIKNSGLAYCIVRLAYPYRASFQKNDFMRAIKNRLENGQAIQAVTDHIFCPTFIDDFAHALEVLITNNSTGIFHIVGSQALSPFEATKCIAKTFGYDEALISKATRDVYFKNRAQRPFNLSLKNDKIKNLGIEMKTFEQGLGEVKKQLIG